MVNSSPAPLVPAVVERAVKEIDPLMICIVLAFAASAPSLAGEAGAVGAISYDLSKRRWFWAALSAISMLPVVGYLPAFLKVGLLLRILNRRLKSLVAMAPEIHRSPEALQMARSVLGKYYHQLPNIRPVRPIRKQLQCIMDVDDFGQMRTEPSQSMGSINTSNSAQMPK